MHQYRSEHRGETASVFQTFLSTDDQKAWEIYPQAVWTQLKDIIYSVLAGSSPPPVNSLSVLLHIPLTLSSPKGNSLCHWVVFFFSKPLFNTQATASILLIYSFWYYFVRVFWQEQNNTFHEVHEAPFPQLSKEILPTDLTQSPPNKKPNTSPPHTHSPLPIRQQNLPLLINLNLKEEHIQIICLCLEICWN